MTHVISANIGSYPRIGEEKDQQRHRRGLTNFLNHEISAHAFHDVEHSVVQEVIREQILYGLDEVTDGLVSWIDPISHFAKNVSGIGWAGYDRYFDTNFYYLRPLIEGKPKLRSPVIHLEYAAAKKLSSKPVRVILTGPLTLALHTSSESKMYDKVSNRIEFYSDVIIEEIKALVKEGPSVIQIDEPALTQSNDSLPLLKKMFEKFQKAATPAKLVLALSFGPVAGLLSTLFSWPLNGLQMDMTFDLKKSIEKLSRLNHSLEIGFGLIDSRCMKMESKEDLIALLKGYLDKHAPAQIYLTPSTGLEYLPRSSAVQKIQFLVSLRNELSTSNPTPSLHG